MPADPTRIEAILMKIALIRTRNGPIRMRIASILMRIGSNLMQIGLNRTRIASNLMKNDPILMRNGLKLRYREASIPAEATMDICESCYVIFCPNHNTVPLLASGGVDWGGVTRIKILRIEK